MGIIPSTLRRHPNRVETESFMLHVPCSGRNITWQYLHSGDGTLPYPYSECACKESILRRIGCKGGKCVPGYGDSELLRFGWNNWEGLGDPFVGRDETSATVVVITPTPTIAARGLYGLDFEEIEQ